VLELGDKDIDHVRGAPYHQQRQGKFERWYQTLKYCTPLKNFDMQEDQDPQIEALVDKYNNQLGTPLSHSHM
jgi:hypothetical protein